MNDTNEANGTQAATVLADDMRVNLEAEFETSNVKEVLDKLDKELIGLEAG